MKRFTEEEMLLAEKLYKEGKSGVEIGKLLNRHRSTITGMLKRRGVYVRDFSESHTVGYNKESFSDFDSDERAAYFYGLLLADGCLVNNTNYITTSVQDSDINILVELKKYLNSPAKIRSKEIPLNGKIYTAKSFSFGNLLIKERLIEQGFESNKSGREKLPKFDWLNNRHFWRGMFDGDGRIENNPSKLELYNSPEITKGFNQYCTEHGLINKRKDPKQVSKVNVPLHRLGYYGDDARNIIKHLYEDCSVSIERKMAVYNELIEKVEHNAIK